MSRKEIKELLKKLGVTNPFSVRAVGFANLMRDNAQCITIKNWTPSPKASEIKAAFAEIPKVIVQFE